MQTLLGTNPVQRYLTFFSDDGPGGGGGSGEGGTGGSGEGGTGEGGSDQGGTGGSDDKRFTQADLDAAATARADKAKRKAEQDLADSLGVSVDEAKDIIKNHKEADDKTKSEAQRAKEAADKAKSDADQEKADAARERRELAIERALVKAGVQDEKLARAARTLELEPDASADDIKVAVDALVKDEPAWFGSTGGGAPNSNPSGRPPKEGKGNLSKMEAGVQRARTEQKQQGYSFEQPKTSKVS